MSVVRKEDEAARRDGVGAGFELAQEIAEAMRLMANPAAGVIAMSAFGFGLASHAFGLWAGVLTGSAQAAQRLLSAEAQRNVAGARGAGAAVASKREKPALKVVVTSEPPVPADVAPVRIAAQGDATSRRTDQAETQSKGTAAQLQPKGPRRPEPMERPAAPDDLKAISGIGPKLEKVLNDLGIWTWRQIAGWERAEIAWIDDRLGFPGRIERDGWVAQARAMPSSTTTAGKA